jgi:DNA repair protein RadD
VKLRWYQLRAVEAVWKHLNERRDNPCVVMPTGSGKSPTIAQIAKMAVGWDGRVLILAHRKELLQQNAEKLRIFAPDLEYGIYSAGLRKRDTAQPVIFAGIQSVYLKAEELGKFDLVIVDEAHLIPPEGEGRYVTFLKVATSINRGLRVVGFTATPYRTKTGKICTKDGILNHVCYEAPIAPLVAQGFLTKLVARGGNDAGEIDTSGVKTIAGEFSAAELEERVSREGMVAAAVTETLKLTKKRSKRLFFCTGVNHATAVVEELQRQGQSAELIVGDTPTKVRADTLQRFRDGRIDYLVNVGVFTEGLDVPDIDAIILLRPTKSPGLYVQMVGRGFRVAEGKKDCLILDYGGNVMRHGPVDHVKGRKKKSEPGEAPMKKCPQCSLMVYTAVRDCPECGHHFDMPEVTHDKKASQLDILAKKDYRIEWETVEHTDYEVHKKIDAPPGHPRTMRVNYRISFWESISEWVCVEHRPPSFAHFKARKWWSDRCDGSIEMPTVAEEAVMMAEQLKKPGKIQVKYGRTRNEYNTIVGYEFPLANGELLSDINAALEEPDQEQEVPF